MRVLFAGGGTGGHINPAISIADYAAARDKDFEALFVGTRSGLETKLVPKAGYNIEYIEIQGFDRKHILRNFETLRKLAAARKRCRNIIREFKPDCIVCTGGYVSGPVAMASKAMKVPSLIHEQNVYPGMTVKGSADYVTYLALSFEETINHMRHKEKCVVTGNPVRSEILKADREKSREKLGIKKPFVLIFGGSLGADRINDAVIEILDKIVKDDKIELLFGTGDRNYEKIMNRINEKGIQLTDSVRVVSYIDNMAECMASADVVVSRAGAITVSEIAALGKPSILIPSPNVVRNHQEQNAREFESKNAAALILEKDLTSDVLYDKIMSMIGDKNTLSRMSENLKPLAKTDALEKLYELMIKMSKGETR
ncbi:MAG: undecaprenyldiphospho-muramoylpentapeptide beta-N-acetylglucosaminyltransferase [Oscillospiraceae bacterium]|nr:undecaprenyldiphospho-muramoylpentapeptide beta-N-acetylglucosaminyltransferase [Oscillospiraceae bacterium]